MVTFDAVSGWSAPASQTVTVSRAQTTVIDGNYIPPAGKPIITSISPPIASNSGGTLLTIAGANFTAPATVLIGGKSATNVTVSSVTQITCIIPSSSTNGTVPVIVQETGGKGNDTLTVIYPSTNQNQTVTFPAIADQTFGDPPIQLLAAASSGLPVAFSVILGAASISNNILTLTGAGAITVEANQLGNNLFNAATPVDVSFNVARANQSIAVTPVQNKSAGDAPFSLVATTSSGLPANFSILSGSASVDNNGVVTLLGSGAVTFIAGQSGNSNYNAAAAVQSSFSVSKIPQTITFGTLSSAKVGDAPFSLNATASSGLPVGYSISGPATLSGNIVVLNGYGTVSVSALQPGNTVYAAAPNVTQTFAVAPINDTLISLSFLTNGSFQMAFYGIVSSNYTLQASTDLANWTSVLNFTCTNSPTLLVDPGAKYLGWRFYRTAQGTLTVLIKLNFNVVPFSKTSGFGLNLQAPLGFNYMIQASTDLINWQPFTNFVSTNTLQYFSDLTATNYNRRFYRALMQ